MECGVNIQKPAALVINTDIIPLQPKQKLYSYEIDSYEELTIESINQEVGEVVVNPRKPGIWGLKNTSSMTWYKNTPGGMENICKPNEVVIIIRGHKIKFGTKGEGSIA